jgi:hypothetical protein
MAQRPHRDLGGTSDLRGLSIILSVNPEITPEVNLIYSVRFAVIKTSNYCREQQHPPILSSLTAACGSKYSPRCSFFWTGSSLPEWMWKNLEWKTDLAVTLNSLKRE